ncbi:neuropilin-2-like [Aulostomus maculatus]
MSRDSRLDGRSYTGSAQTDTFSRGRNTNASSQEFDRSQPCGGYLDASDAGYITTPGYPLEYPPHQNCHWVITAPEPSQRIVLNFNPHFEIEKLDCRYDYVEIHDGNSETADLLGKHCSNIAPAPIISSGPSLHIKFVSDYAHQGAGFSLRYEIFKTGSDCSRNFTSPSGLIESPGFPDKYPHNLECSFIVIVPPSMDVTLTFLTFDLENDPLPGAEGDCKYDWLEVWDGLPGVGPLIGRYCGTMVPPEIQSSTGILSLSFHTDMAVAKDGFSARYNMTHKEVSETFHCSNAFGMESGKITDDQITASSSFYDERWQPHQARLNYNDNGWTPNEDSNREYIQVDLYTLKVLTGIAMQGAISKETQKSYYVTTFKLEVSTNGEDWMVYRHGKNHKLHEIYHACTQRRCRHIRNSILLPNIWERAHRGGATVTQKYLFPGWPSSFSTPSSSDLDPPSVTLVSEKDKDNAWLYTLDPILLTIIVMSSLGVLLGAVCAGLLLYCTCSYSGLSSRSSTTLENYNFELYDGIKHKVKINQQKCCSEA